MRDTLVAGPPLGLGESVEVIPLSEAREGVLRVSRDHARDVEDLLDRAKKAEAALAAARQVDEAMVERAAEAISDGFEQGYRTHWCAEWDYEPGSGCDRCREVARAALLAALNAEGEVDRG
jgi:hypothetical protein